MSSVDAAHSPFVPTAGSSAYYVRTGEDSFDPTIHCQGAWRDDEQHMAPAGSLLLHEIDRRLPRADVQTARICFEILGMIPLRPGRVEVEVVRPGRTIELIEARHVIDGRVVIRALVWRLQRSDTADVAAHDVPAIPRPDELIAGRFSELWGGDFIAGLEMRCERERTPGHGVAWIRSPFPLVDGEPSMPSTHAIRLADCANGLATRYSPTEWGFANIDLTIHLFREPSPGWLGLDISVPFGPTGVGLTSAWLHDESGPFGRTEQILTLRRSGI